MGTKIPAPRARAAAVELETDHPRLPPHARQELTMGLSAAASASASSSTSSSSSSIAEAMAAAVLMPDSGVYIDDSDSSEYVAPLQTPHFYWDCCPSGPNHNSSLPVRALIDHVSSLVMIDEKVVNDLRLKRRSPAQAMNVQMAVGNKGQKVSEWVKIKPQKKDFSWCSKSLKAVVVP